MPVEDLSVEEANPAIAVDTRSVMSFHPLSTDPETATLGLLKLTTRRPIYSVYAKPEVPS